MAAIDMVAGLPWGLFNTVLHPFLVGICTFDSDICTYSVEFKKIIILHYIFATEKILLKYNTTWYEHFS